MNIEYPQIGKGRYGGLDMEKIHGSVRIGAPQKTRAEPLLSLQHDYP